MKNGMNWYKRQPLNYLGGVQGLTVKQHAVYAVIIDLIYLHGGPINNDPKWVSGYFSDLGPAAVRNTISELISLGKLTENEMKISQKRAENEMKTQSFSRKNPRLSSVYPTFSDHECNEINDLENESDNKKSLQIRIDKIREDITPIVPLAGDTKKSRKKRASSLPENFPDQDSIQKAVDEGFSPSTADKIAAEFRLSCEAHDRRYVNWNAAWLHWLRSPYNKHPKGGGTAETVDERRLRLYRQTGNWPDAWGDKPA